MCTQRFYNHFVIYAGNRTDHKHFINNETWQLCFRGSGVGTFHHPIILPPSIHPASVPAALETATPSTRSLLVPLWELGGNKIYILKNFPRLKPEWEQTKTEAIYCAAHCSRCQGCFKRSDIGADVSFVIPSESDGQVLYPKEHLFMERTNCVCNYMLLRLGPSDSSSFSSSLMLTTSWLHKLAVMLAL